MHCTKCGPDSKNIQVYTPHGEGIVCSTCFESGIFMGDPDKMKEYLKSNPPVKAIPYQLISELVKALENVRDCSLVKCNGCRTIATSAIEEFTNAIRQ